MAGNWKPPSFLDFGKRLSTSPEAAGRELDQAIQQAYKRLDSSGFYHGAGATTKRPTPPAAAVGSYYFDSTLGHVVWWNGKKWVDATGGEV